VSRVAAIDIGTNSVRLLVAESMVGQPELITLDRQMRITRLGQGVDATHALAADSIDRTVRVLSEYRTIIDNFEVTNVRATATSAARDATNSDEFFTRAHAALGVTPELLSGEAEAQLSFAGATAGLTNPAPYLTIDIGGGSTEFVFGSTEPESLCSLNIGCVRITERWLSSDPCAPEELANAVSDVRDELSQVATAIPQLSEARTVLGLAGTLSTVAAVDQGLAEYDRDRIHHFCVTRAIAEDVFRTLALESVAERKTNPGLEPERAEVIVGGLIVLVATIRAFGIEEILVSEADILDGLASSIA